MNWSYLCLVTAVVLAGSPANGVAVQKSETLQEKKDHARAWLAKIEDDLVANQNRKAIANWKFESNISDETKKFQETELGQLAEEDKVTVSS